MNPKKKKKNLFDRAKIEFYNYDEFIQLFARCSKLVVSEKVKDTVPFPNIIHLNPDSDECLYDPEFLLRLRDYFDKVKSFDSFAYKIVIGGGGKNYIDNATSVRDLAKKRRLLNRILTDVINKSKEKFKLEDSKKNNSKRIYNATLKSSMVTYPPNKISIAKFNDYISKANNVDRDLLITIYKQVDNYYCSQRRINKDNFSKVAEIIFNLKHLPYENE